eukprot:gene23971-32375_t
MSTASSQQVSVRTNKKGWTKEEDSKLIELIQLNGTTGKWSKTAIELGFNRTGKQCRERYQNHLRPEINKNDWSAEEDKIVMKMKEELGSQWAKISTFLIGRSDNAVKNRWHLINRYANSAKYSKRVTKNVKVLSAELSKKLLVSKSASSEKVYSAANTEQIATSDASSSLKAIPLERGEKVLKKRVHREVTDFSETSNTTGVVDSAFDALNLAFLYHAHNEHAHDAEPNFKPPSCELTVPASVNIWEKPAAAPVEFAVPKPYLGHKYKKLRILHSPTFSSNASKQVSTETTASISGLAFSPTKKDATYHGGKRPCTLLIDNGQDKKQFFNTASPALKSKLVGLGFEHQWIDDFLSADSNPNSSSAESPFSENLKSLSIIHDEQDGVAHDCFPSVSLPYCNGRRQRAANVSLSQYHAADRSLMLLDVDDETDEFSGLSISEQSFCFSPTPLSICELTQPMKSSRPGSSSKARPLNFPTFSTTPIFRFPTGKLFSSSAPSPVKGCLPSGISEKENIPDN